MSKEKQPVKFCKFTMIYARDLLEMINTSGPANGAAAQALGLDQQ